MEGIQLVFNESILVENKTEVNVDLSRIITTEEKLIRAAYASFFPKSKQEKFFDKPFGRVYVDIVLQEVAVELKDAEKETLLNQAITQAQRNYDAKWKPASVLVAYNFGSENRLRQAEMYLNYRKENKNSEITILTESASNPLKDRKENVEKIREINIIEMTDIYPFDYIENWKNKCLEIDRQVWGQSLFYLN